VLHPNGLWIVQMSYLPMMLKQNEVGNICHEHLEYYSMQSFEYLLGLFDLEIVDVELNEINGGSLRAYIRHRGADGSVFGDATYRGLAAERVRAMRENEIKLGLDDTRTYAEFAFWVERIKSDVVDFIRTQVGKGKKVYVYGASTKGNTVLQYFGLDRTLITAAAERNPDKWGKVTVGTRVPIVSEDAARAAKPDYFLVLPWHFVEEFQAREKHYLLAGGRFILPAPRFALI
jgi:NDP-4-keto-2,6-dideoxyhexose 3-C-methyltransferase